MRLFQYQFRGYCTCGDEHIGWMWERNKQAALDRLFDNGWTIIELERVYKN